MTSHNQGPPCAWSQGLAKHSLLAMYHTSRWQAARGGHFCMLRPQGAPAPARQCQQPEHNWFPLSRLLGEQVRRTRQWLSRAHMQPGQPQATGQCTCHQRVCVAAAASGLGLCSLRASVTPEPRTLPHAGSYRPCCMLAGTAAGATGWTLEPTGDTSSSIKQAWSCAFTRACCKAGSCWRLMAQLLVLARQVHGAVCGRPCDGLAGVPCMAGCSGVNSGRAGSTP